MALQEIKTSLQSRAQIPPTWQNQLDSFLKTNEFRALESRVEAERSTCAVFPPRAQTYRALELTAFDQVRVVILGQDPYHGEGQAHGLAFSVPAGVRRPPSLNNILKELATDLGAASAPEKIPSRELSGDLSHWAEQGVLLLNSVLTVRADQPGSHSRMGWQALTDLIISKASESHEHVVFILWGAFAQKKAALIDSKRHLILNSVHPSPLSAHRGFFGSRPFSQTNRYLIGHGLKPIDWRVP